MTKNTLSALLIISIALATIGLTIETDPANAEILNTALKFLAMLVTIFVVLLILVSVYTSALKK